MILNLEQKKKRPSGRFLSRLLAGVAAVSEQELAQARRDDCWPFGRPSPLLGFGVAAQTRYTQTKAAQLGRFAFPKEPPFDALIVMH